MNGPKLPLPQELGNVPERALKDFLVQYSRLLCDQFGQPISEGRLRAFVTDVLSESAAVGPARPADVVLEFKHVCRFSGCNLDDCQLCRNNPSKVCEASTVFDRQYWVRDDGKGGQVIKARCGADVSLALTDRTTGQAVLLPDVTLKLYVVSGHNAGAVAATEAPGGLYLSDDGHPLFSAANCTPDDEGGITLELTQDDMLGAVAPLPEFQFLDKNSKFKSGGRTFKAFKLLARALQVDPVTGQASVMAQVESETFKVTTKKGYDGCRKAEYLFAHQPITDKTFATLGETTISNLKTTFEGVETVEDLMRLVQASASAPELQARLRDTLNMARDTDKWKKLTRMLSERVVWDDSIMRLFVLPTGSRPLGLLFRANKGQVDFEGVLGLVYQPPLPTGQLRAVRTNDRSLAGCGRHFDALKQMAASYWGLPRHPGWTLAPEQPKWELAVVSSLAEVFADVLGQGDPVAAAELHWMQLAATLQTPSAHTGSAGPSPLRSPTPLSSDNHAAAVAAVMAAADTNGLLAGASIGGAAGVGSSGGYMQGSGNHAPAAAAAAAGMPGFMPRGAVVSPFEGSTAMNTALMAAAATGAGFGASGGFSGQLSSGQLGGLNRPSGLLVPGATSSGMVLVSPAGQVDASTYGLPASSMHISGRTTSCATEQTSETASHSTQNQQSNLQPMQQQQQQMLLLQQQMQQQQQVQLGMRGDKSMGVPPNMAQVGQLGQAVPTRTVSGPAYGPTAAATAAGTSGPVYGPLAAAGVATCGPGSTSAPFGGLAGNLAGLDMPIGLAAAGNSSSGGPSGLSSQQGLDPLTMQNLGLAAGGNTQGMVQAQSMSQQQQQLPQPFTSVQQPQQQQGVFTSPHLVGEPMVPGISNKTLLLQQAIVEGWPAPQVKSLLDQMSDDELQQLVALHKASEAAANAAAGGGAVPAAAVQAVQAVQTPQAGAGGLQGFGSTVPLPGSTSNLSAGQQLPPSRDQQQQGAAAAAAAAGGAAAPTNDTATAALAALFADAGVSAAAAGGELRAMSDVQLTGDQGAALQGGLLTGLDSFTGADLSQWGDLFNDLRHISSGSGNPPGSLTGINSFTTDWIPELLSKRASGRIDPIAAAVAGTAPAAAADGGQAVAAAAAGTDQPGSNHQQQIAGAAAAAAGAGDGEGADVLGGADGSKARKSKRERSKTGQAPTAEQRQEWQSLFGGDVDNPELRSLSKAETHYDSFNRHFPVARLTSKTAEVQQGGQVANPFGPGQRLSATGVGHHPAAVVAGAGGMMHPVSPNSPNPFLEGQIGGSPNTRPPVTTDSPQVPERSRMVSGDLDGVTSGPSPPGSGSLPGLPVITESDPAAAAAAVGTGGGARAATPPLAVPPAQTEAGAAAVESLTGLRSGLSEAGPEGSVPSGGLRGILELMCSDAAAAADGTAAGAGAGAGLNVFLSGQRTDSDAAAVAAAAAADNPFSVAAREPMHPPAPHLREASTHRDSFGRTGWISSLFRRSSSLSSKSNSGAVGSGGSGSGPSGGSQTSKDRAGAGLTQSGSVRGPAPAAGGNGNGQ